MVAFDYYVLILFYGIQTPFATAPQDILCVFGGSFICVGIWDCVLLYEVSEFVFLCKLIELRFEFFFFYANKKKSLLLYTVKVATDNFFDANKLGEGGFGVVYKVNVTLLLTSKGMI